MWDMATISAKLGHSTRKSQYSLVTLLTTSSLIRFFVVLNRKRCPFFQGLDTNIGRSADHRVKARIISLKGLGESTRPIKRIGTILCLLIKQGQLVKLIKVRVNQ